MRSLAPRWISHKASGGVLFYAGILVLVKPVVKLGINKMEWICIERPVYDACLDSNEYRAGPTP
ncbi:MAG: hypothetical protein V1809_12030 [Planctomycetota bacterium]